MTTQDYASRKGTLDVLQEFGFVRDTYVPDRFHSPKRIGVDSVVSVRLYLSTAGWYCINVLPSGWGAPIVWNGPKAEHDTADQKEEFIKYLDKNYPGWR